MKSILLCSTALACITYGTVIVDAAPAHAAGIDTTSDGASDSASGGYDFGDGRRPFSPNYTNADGKKVKVRTGGVKELIDAYGICRWASNNWHKDAHVPLGTVGEWASYVNNAPAHLPRQGCCAPTNISVCDTTLKLGYGHSEMGSYSVSAGYSRTGEIYCNGAAWTLRDMAGQCEPPPPPPPPGGWGGGGGGGDSGSTDTDGDGVTDTNGHSRGFGQHSMGGIGSRSNDGRGGGGGGGGGGPGGGAGANGSDGPGGSADGSSCFAAGTPVIMADGSEKGIDLIQIGDTVMAYADQASDLVPRLVTAIMSHDDVELLDIDGLLVTAEHPLLADGNVFVPAGDIVAGDRLVTARGDIHIVAEALRVTGRHKVYNITVDDLHVYCAGGFRVHNKI